MRRGLVIIALSLWMLGAFCSAAQAGFSNLFTFDCTVLDDTDLGDHCNMVEIGDQFSQDQWVLGGFYSTSLSSVSKTAYSFYVGLNLLPDDAYTFAVVAGYLVWKDEIALGNEEVTSMGFGFLSAARYEAYGVSLLFLYGLSNSYEIGGVEPIIGIKDASYLQFNTDFFIFDNIGLDIVYRTYAYKLKNDFKWRDSGLGVGMVVKFE